MEGAGFLKTVNFGGFDKKDVLAYIDDLNTKIYALENEVEEKKALLEDAGDSGIDSEKYEKLLATDKAKITELQTLNDSVKNQLNVMEEDLEKAEEENKQLKEQIAELEEQLQEAKNKIAAGGAASTDSAMDLGNVFIEAQKTANIIVTQAKENARKMDEDAKKLANQVVDDANGKASTIVKSADEKATKLITEAEDKSYEVRTNTENIKAAVAEEMEEIEGNIAKLREVLEMFSSESLSKLEETQSIIEATNIALNKDVDAPAAKKPAPAPAPAPEKKPSSDEGSSESGKQVPKFGGFDMSGLEEFAINPND